MKNLLVAFLILIITCSIANSSKLKKEEKKSEVRNLLEKQNALPAYSKTPFQLLMDQTIHGDFKLPSKMFYTRLSLKPHTDTFPTAYWWLYDTNLPAKKFFETNIHLPYQMAKLEVDFTYFLVIINPSQNLVPVTFELYVGNTKIAEEYMLFRMVELTNTIHLGGVLFNVPAGNHNIYVKVVNPKDASTRFNLKLTPNISGWYDERAAFLQDEPGNIEVVGYPLEN